MKFSDASSPCYLSHVIVFVESAFCQTFLRQQRLIALNDSGNNGIKFTAST